LLLGSLFLFPITFAAISFSGAIRMASGHLLSLCPIRVHAHFPFS
jgi:hypothetical protein